MHPYLDEFQISIHDVSIRSAKIQCSGIFRNWMKSIWFGPCRVFAVHRPRVVIEEYRACHGSDPPNSQIGTPMTCTIVGRHALSRRDSWRGESHRLDGFRFILAPPQFGTLEG